MYSALCEEDMWAGLWQKQAKFRETATAIAYEQQGFFEQALGAYELAMNKIRMDYCSAPIPPTMNSEVMLWDKHWTRSVLLAHNIILFSLHNILFATV